MLQPQAPELEETILGACLIEKEGMALIDELLKPEMFYVTRHQLIYAALQAMFHAGTNIDILTATEELRKRGKLDDAGECQQFAESHDHFPSDVLALPKYYLHLPPCDGGRCLTIPCLSS